jgi:prophage regulatory protein
VKHGLSALDPVRYGVGVVNSLATFRHKVSLETLDVPAEVVLQVVHDLCEVNSPAALRPKRRRPLERELRENLLGFGEEAVAGLFEMLAVDVRERSGGSLGSFARRSSAGHQWQWWTAIPFLAVRERTGLSRSTIWRLERQGEFPRHHRISPSVVAWVEEDVTSWIERKRGSVVGDRRTNAPTTIA